MLEAHLSVYETLPPISGSGAPDGTVLQNSYPADIVSWLAKSAKQIMNLYDCGSNL